jgi:hypothetical protein
MVDVPKNSEQAVPLETRTYGALFGTQAANTGASRLPTPVFQRSPTTSLYTSQQQYYDGYGDSSDTARGGAASPLQIAAESHADMERRVQQMNQFYDNMRNIAYVTGCVVGALLVLLLLVYVLRRLLIAYRRRKLKTV